MSTRTSLLTFLASGLAAAAVHFAFYDPALNSPSFLRPAALIFYGALLFLGTNILVFSFNLLRALFSVRGSKDELEVERVVVPALQGRVEDERLMRYSAIPFFAGLGLIITGILIAIFR
jgi:hypothetical protein